mmetsp:Transcript_56061/g.112336  ORF Transcript_56061/g.112336 Transcript_56061/m.112336 type:complete len:356 (+) Transcript_56061:392-1459(+)
MPSRNSCTSTPSFTMPRPLIAPLILSKAVFVSSREVHLNTSSLPADWMGLTTTTNGSGFHSVRNASMSAHSVARFCCTARTPAPRTVSPMTYLLRRASERSSGFARVPRRTERWSARMTPVSAPGTTATMGQSSMDMRCATVLISPSSSGKELSCWMVTAAAPLAPAPPPPLAINCGSVSAAADDVVDSSPAAAGDGCCSLLSAAATLESLNTSTSRYPLASTSAATFEPDENGSTTTTAPLLGGTAQIISKSISWPLVSRPRSTSTSLASWAASTLTSSTAPGRVKQSMVRRAKSPGPSCQSCERNEGSAWITCLAFETERTTPLWRPTKNTSHPAFFKVSGAIGNASNLAGSR